MKGWIAAVVAMVVSFSMGGNLASTCACDNVHSEDLGNLSVIWAANLARWGETNKYLGVAWPNSTIGLRTNETYNETLRVCNHEVLHTLIDSAPPETDKEEEIVEWLDDRVRLPFCDELIKKHENLIWQG